MSLWIGPFGYQSDGWMELCGFLKEPIPDAPYPWINSNSKSNLDSFSTQ
jgi:hypothetical protein